jgi:redox-sensitive bicupin YhaK (pirin superfamily)
MVAIANDGKAVTLVVLEDSHEPLSALVIAGAPLHWPVLRYGPFVMNTEAEIRQALIDYQSVWSASVLPASPLSTGRSKTD